jgi:MFS family permease
MVRKTLNRYTILLLILVSVAQLATANLILAFPSTFLGVLLLLAYYSSVFLGAPTQGHVSDKYHRKSMLVSAFAVLTATQFAIGCFDPSHIVIFGVSACLFGVWGNGDVIARAALFDQQRHATVSDDKSDRLLMGLSFAVLAPPWIVASLSKQWLPTGAWSFGFGGIWGLLAIGICFFIHDRADNETHTEISSVRKLLFSNKLWYYLVVLVLLQLAYQLVFLKQDVISRSAAEFKTLENIIATSLFIGCSLMQAFLPYRDATVIRAAVAMSFCGLLLTSVLQVFASDLKLLHAITGFGLISASAGAYLPRYFLHHKQAFQKHEHGAVFGLLEASLVFGEMGAALIMLTPVRTIVPLASSLLMLFGVILLRWTAPSSNGPPQF